MWRKEFSLVVRKSLEAARAQGGKISLRGYAKRLGLSITALTDILEGADDWKITEARALDILDRIDIGEYERNHLKARMNLRVEYSKTATDGLSSKLVADPVYMIVAAAYDLPPLRRTEEAISKMLKLDVQTVGKITAELLELGHLIRGPEGIVSRAQKFWETSEEAAPEAVTACHATGFRLAGRALTEVPRKERVVGTLFFSGNSANLEKVREEILAFEEKVVALLDQEPHDHVFQLQFALHPAVLPKKD